MYTCESCGRDDFANPVILESHKESYCPARQADPVQQEEDHSEKVLVGRLEIPHADPNYYIEDTVLDEVKRLMALTEQEPQNLGIKGPAGSGKSTMAMQIAALRRSPAYIANSFTMQSSDQWFGREWVDMKKGGMFYEPSLFVEAVETEGATVIINDINLMQNKSVQNGLNDILDPSLRHTWVDQMARSLGRPVRVAPQVLIIATWNEGVEYTGTIKLAANILDRFQNMIYMDYPDAETQKAVLIRKTGVPYKDAGRLVHFGERLRELDEPVAISMRKLLMAAAKMVIGAHIRDALYFTVISGLNVELQEKALAALETIYEPQEKALIAQRETKFEAWADRGLSNGK